jgi:hypothetical protein
LNRQPLPWYLGISPQNHNPFWWCNLEKVDIFLFARGFQLDNGVTSPRFNPQRLKPFSYDIHTIHFNMKVARCWPAYPSKDTFHFEQEVSCTDSEDPNNWCPFMDPFKYGRVVFYRSTIAGSSKSNSKNIIT